MKNPIAIFDFSPFRRFPSLCFSQFWRYCSPGFRPANGKSRASGVCAIESRLAD
jgi:hypothetical protein